MRVYVRTRRTEIGGSDLLLVAHKLQSRLRWHWGALPWGQYEPLWYFRAKRIKGGLRIGVRLGDLLYTVWDTQWLPWTVPRG